MTGFLKWIVCVDISVVKISAHFSKLYRNKSVKSSEKKRARERYQDASLSQFLFTLGQQNIEKFKVCVSLAQGSSQAFRSTRFTKKQIEIIQEPH